jgi:pimeloyl-ACP methyl ester carboxylesterase
LTDYATSRDAAYAARIQTEIEDFASQFEMNAYSSVQKRTIFLFPGGLGSQLMRAYQAYPDPAQSFEKAWLDFGIWFDVPHLAMKPGGFDTEEKYIVPDSCVNIAGPISFFHAYEVFMKWCRRNSIDLFVFGWDWRRSVQDAADFFLNDFLPMFDARFSGMTPHPLDHFTFLGHSAGGMVVKAMLNSTANQYVQRVKKAITVATPFYGYGDQIRRFLKGDENLLWAGFPRSDSARIVSSLPGGYEYPYLDYPTYLANQAAFAHDPEGYNLTAYPSMDQDKPTEVADPYDPQPGADGRVRYPLLYGFQSSLLYKGNVTARNISSALTDTTIRAKLHNIRGVKTQNGQPVNTTAVGVSWARVSPLFSADFDPDPIHDQMGPGDGTQPAWTTKLLGLPAGQIITIQGDDVEHANMLDLDRVRARIAQLIGLNVDDLDFVNDVPGLEELAASLEDFIAFAEGLAEFTSGREIMPKQRSALRSEYLRQFKPVQLQALLARFYLESVNHPGKARIPSKDGKHEPTASDRARGDKN